MWWFVSHIYFEGLVECRCTTIETFLFLVLDLFFSIFYHLNRLSFWIFDTTWETNPNFILKTLSVYYFQSSCYKCDHSFKRRKWDKNVIFFKFQKERHRKIIIFLCSIITQYGPWRQHRFFATKNRCGRCDRHLRGPYSLIRYLIILLSQ